MFARPFPTLAAVAALAGAVSAQGISWSKDLSTAFAQAKAQDKILLICVNAKYVDGQKKEERANKGLREVVYKDARVVKKSREFICALLTPSSKSAEFGELRMLGIEGAIVSPQHIFVKPAGDAIVLRKQYWSHGKGEEAVRKLLELMDEAQRKHAGGAGDGDAGPTPVAPSGDDRAGWIRDRLKEVVDGPTQKRKRAIDALIAGDKDGDCTTPLTLLLEEHKKNIDLVVDLIRGLGRDGLVDAALVIPPFLAHRNDSVRGNAAVSLEYIGSKEKKVVEALLKAARKEKNEDIASHMYRALGRCGAGDAKVRSTLVKKCGSAKSEFAAYGPAIGLAYFEGDKRAARSLEKLVKKIGIPGGRRGGGQNIVLRGVFCWTLASINDPKTAKFMREELIAALKNTKAFWVDSLISFYRNVAFRCEGDDAAMGRVTGSVAGFASYARGANPARYDVQARSMMDEYRKGRDFGNFTPKGDYLLGPAGDS